MKADRDIEKLKEPFRTKVKLFLNEVGDRVFITEAWRSDERQQELYNQGRTTTGNIVTWTRYSNHQDGIAIDIAFSGKELYPKDINKWRKIANIAKKYGIDWGYNLWGVDKPHFQDNGKPLIKKNMFGKNITINGLTFPSSIYGVKIELSDEKFTRTGLLKLKGVNTKKDTYIILNTSTIRQGNDKVSEVLFHEFSHLIYHTILKTDIFEKINKNDFKLTKYEYWDYISRNLKHYITKYASTHSAEDFAELIGYGYYIENKKELPKKATFNDDVKFKYIIAKNFFDYGLKKYLENNKILGI